MSTTTYILASKYFKFYRSSKREGVFVLVV